MGKTPEHSLRTHTKMLSVASSSCLGFAALQLPNPAQPVINRIAEISIVGFDKRQTKRSLQAVKKPLRRAQSLREQVGALICMQVSEDMPPVFSPIEDAVQLPDPKDFDPNEFVQTLPGITAPFGFFDPVGFCSSQNGADGAATEGKVRFYREVELKHGRVAMLAALGFPLAESFHPLFGGDIDVPSYVAFQQTPLQTFWPAVVGLIAVIEVFSIIPAFEDPNIEGWAIKSDHVAGDYGFDPLGLKPSDPAELKEMQTKELNNGRLAMIAIAGMVAQELVSGQKLF